MVGSTGIAFRQLYQVRSITSGDGIFAYPIPRVSYWLLVSIHPWAGSPLRIWLELFRRDPGKIGPGHGHFATDIWW